jgi:hypothetical protein
VAEYYTLNKHSGTSHTVTFTFRDVVKVFGVRLMLSRGGSWHGRHRQDVYIMHVYCITKTTTKEGPTGPENKKEIDLPVVILLFKQGAT